MNTTRSARHIAVYALASLLVGATLSACSGEPRQQIRTISLQQVSTIHLSIRQPRQVVLRALETEDPMQRITSLRLLFYHTGDHPTLAEVREVDNPSTKELQDLPISLPEGDYQLVAIANASTKLISLTQPGSPLSNLSEATALSTSDLILIRENRIHSVAMLNSQGPVAVKSTDFASEAKPISLVLEPALARVFLYGTPALASGATTGSAAAGYTLSGMVRRMELLRPSGALLTEGTADTESVSIADSYPRGAFYQLLEKGIPEDMSQHLSYFLNAWLKPTSGMSAAWVKLATSLDEQPQRLSSMPYGRETTIPPTAYLAATVPTIYLRYPYIPSGLTLQENEGWVSFRGQYYSESSFREMVQQDDFPSEALRTAVHEAQITADSFTLGFEKSGIAFHHQSYSYYAIPIRHFDDTKAPKANSIGRYGLVRGNEYRIHLTRILRPGSAILPDRAADRSPLVEEKDIRSTISIQPVTTRESEAHL